MTMLFLFVFLLIYAPVLNVGLGPFADLIVLFSIAVSTYYFFTSDKVTVHKSVFHLIIILLVIAVWTIINILLFEYNFAAESLRGVLRPIKAILNLLGCYSVVQLYYRWKGKSNNIEQISKHVYMAIVLHAIIMLCQFLNPEFRQFIYSFTGADRQLEFYQNFRMAGLAGAGGAQISAFQGLGFFIGSYLAFYSIVSRKLIFLGQILILTSCFLSGRTGLFIVMLFGPLFVFFIYFVHRFREFTRVVWTTVFAIVLATSFISYLYMENFFGNKFVEVAFKRTFDTIINYDSNAGIQDDTFSALEEMWVFPNDMQTLIFGQSRLFTDGGSHAGTGPRILQSDIGYVRFLWSYGLIGSILNYLFYVYLLMLVMRNKVCGAGAKLLSVFLIFLILVLHSKEVFIFTRHGFSIICLLAFAITLKPIGITKK